MNFIWFWQPWQIQIHVHSLLPIWTSACEWEMPHLHSIFRQFCFSCLRADGLRKADRGFIQIPCTFVVLEALEQDCNNITGISLYVKSILADSLAIALLHAWMCACMSVMKLIVLVWDHQNVFWQIWVSEHILGNLSTSGPEKVGSSKVLWQM